MGESFRGFASIGTGNMTVGVQTSFPLDAFIFKENDSYHVGINRDFTYEQLFEEFSNFSKANASVNENLLAIGWSKGNKAQTIEVNLRSYSSAYFDLELVRMGYYELAGVPYSLERTKASTRNWAEIAYGFKSEVTESLSFGARIKGLIGLNYSYLDSSSYNFEDGNRFTDELSIRGTGNFYSTNTFLMFKSTDGLIDLKPEGLGNYSIAGFGAAADLGMKYTTDGGIEISASILDLGGLFWNNKIYGIVSDRPIENYRDVFKLKEEELDHPTKFAMNPVTVEAGARYHFGEKLSAGALATVRLDNTSRGWYEVRAGGAYSPAKVFSIAASAALNTLGSGVGFAMNFRVPGIAFTLGTDSLIDMFSLNSDYIPARRINTNIHAGLSIAW